MKRLIAIALCAVLLWAAALCEETGGDSIRLSLSEGDVTLLFDDTEGYSTVVDGNVQASFYAYTDDESLLYELYMVFPEQVTAGDVITPEYAREYAPETSVVLVVSTTEVENYYFAYQNEDGTLPEGASYAIAFDEVTDVGNGVRYAGRLTATLTRMDMDTGFVEITEAPFSFTMPAANRRAKDDEPFDTDPPAATPQPYDDGPVATPAPVAIDGPQKTYTI